jgi:hypothetical protein
MKVVCINEKDNIWLTLGKIYDNNYIDKDWYWIINDNGYGCRYSKKYFKPLSEIRNETINKLLE